MENQKNIKQITQSENNVLRNLWSQWKFEQHGIINNQCHLDYMIQHPMCAVLKHNDMGDHTTTIKIFQKTYLDAVEKIKSLCCISNQKFDQKLLDVLREYPEIKSSGIFNILSNVKGSKCIYREVQDNKQIFYVYDFKNWSDEDVLRFVTKTQTKEILMSYSYQSLRPFIDGKISQMMSRNMPNIVGKANEKILQKDINTIGSCFNDILISRQMSNKLIRDKFKISLAPSRFIWDTIIFYKDRVICIEFSYYTRGGTKPKATSKQFQQRQKYCQKNGYIFIWITDGLGWKSNKNDLKQAINGITYVLNTQLLCQGALWFIVECINKINGE